MAQGNRSSRPKTTCCRCRRRAEGVSRLTNLGWLCDTCYDMLQRTDLGQRLYRLVYHYSGRPVLRREQRRVEPVEATEARAGAEQPVGMLVG